MRTPHKAALACAGLLASLCIPTAQATANTTATTATTAAPAPQPDDPALTPYYSQHPAWHRCGTGPENPASYQCATITVPLDYARPTGPTLRLRISRLRTSTPDNRHGVLLSNPGGPGTIGLSMPLGLKAALPKSVLSRYDLIGFDPRGLGTSSPLDCGLTERESYWPRGYRGKAVFAHDTALARDFATRCTAKYRDRLPYITTRDTARDMDVIRGVLGEPRVSYLGWSYGTYLGAVYAQLFPTHSDRFVLDSSVDPNHFGRDLLRTWAISSEPAFLDWSRNIARKNGTYHLGRTPAAVRATFLRLVARANRTPLRYEGTDYQYQGRAVNGADIRDWLRGEFFFQQDQAAREINTLLKSRVTHPDPEPSNKRADSFDANVGALHWAVICADNSASWPRSSARYRHDAVRESRLHPLYGDFAGNITPCAFWPRGAEPATRVDNTVPTLVVQNQWDSQTPLTSGLAMHHALHGSRLVYVAGGRGHGVYPSAKGPTGCADHAVNAYLVTGALPAHDVTCHAG